MLAKMQNTGYSILYVSLLLILFGAGTVEAGKFDNGKGKRYGHFKTVEETTDVTTDTTTTTDTTVEADTTTTDTTVEADTTTTDATVETGTVIVTDSTDTTIDTVVTDATMDEPVAYSKLILSWSTPSDFESVIGYYIYYGKDMSTIGLISDISIASTDFDIHSPSISFDISQELGTQIGETACFQIKSYSERATSSISDVVCSAI